MLNDDANGSRARSVSNLDPISAERRFRRQINAESGDGVAVGVLDQQVST